MKNTLLACFVLIFFVKSSDAQLFKPFFQTRQGLSCSSLNSLFDYILSAHYSKQKFDEKVKERSYKQYLNLLDASKTQLFASDVPNIRKEIFSLYSSMKKGDCTPLERIRDIVLKRSAEKLEFVNKYLDKNYKFNENVSFVSNPDKRDYFKSEKDRKKFLETYVHFQISNYLLSDTKLKEAKRLLKKRYALVVKRIREKKVTELYEEFSKAFASALDPHTAYWSVTDLEDFNIDMNLSLEGIGAQLSSKDGFTVVEEIIPGGAADRGKDLQPKDKIIAVAQDGKPPVSVIDMELKNVVRLIRGKKGSKVHLTVLRKKTDNTDRLKVSIIRDKIDLKDSAAKLKIEDFEVDGKKYKLGHLELPGFYQGSKKKKNSRSAVEDVKKLLIKARKEKVDGLIFDLSYNGGGVLEGARQIGGLFIKRGPIVATRDTAGQVKYLEDNDSNIYYSGPLVVLTNRFSASASEIVAGALRDYGRALVVGADHTFGKGTVQEVRPLPYNWGAVKVTTAMFFIPGGDSTQNKGVDSHFAFPSILNTDEIGEKALDYALKSQQMPKFIGKDSNFADPEKRWEPLNKDIIKYTKSQSKKRVNASKKFKEINKDIKESKENKDVINLAEIRSKAIDLKKKEEKEKKKDGKKKSRSEKRDDLNEPYVKEAKNVLVDLIKKLREKSGRHVAKK